MTYNTNIERDDLSINQIGIVKPITEVTGFTLTSGILYDAPFTLGPFVYAVDVDAVNYTEASSFDSVGAGEYYLEGGVIRIGSGFVPSNTFVTYGIYFATSNYIWHHQADDTTKPVVQYEPMVVALPTDKQQTKDSLYGSLVSASGNINLTNIEKIYDNDVKNSSFNNVEITVWDIAGDLILANLKPRFAGTCNSVTWSQNNITIRVQDRLTIFDQSITPTGIYQYTTIDSISETTAGITSLDARHIGKPVRKAFGRCKGVECIRIDDEGKDWILPDCEYADVSFTAGTGNTTSTINLSAAAIGAIGGKRIVEVLEVGDVLVFPGAAGGSLSDDYKITSVNVVGNSVGFSFNGTTVPNSEPGIFLRVVPYVIAGVESASGITSSDLMTYERGFYLWTTSLYTSGGTSYVKLSFPSKGSPLNPGEVDYLPQHRLFVDCMGSGDSSVSSESAGIFGRMSQITRKLVNDLDPGAVGEFDSTTLGIDDYDQNLIVPDALGKVMPSYRALIEDILESNLTKLVLGEDRLWSLIQTEPFGAVDYSIDDTDTVNNSFKYAYDYRDLITNVIVEYGSRESEFRNFGVGLVGTPHDFSLLSPREGFTSQITNTAKARFYKKTKQRTVKSTLAKEADAITIRERYKFALGDRRGVATVQLPKEYLNIAIGDIIAVNISRDNVDQSFIVIGYEKNSNIITVTLDDQKGIEDNSGSW